MFMISIINRGGKGRTVHSCSWTSSPNALENTRPPIGLPMYQNKININICQLFPQIKNCIQNDTANTPALTIPIRSMRVQLPTPIALGDIHKRQVTDAGHLHEVGGDDEVRAGDGAVGDETRAVARLRAPGDFDTLRVADGR